MSGEIVKGTGNILDLVKELKNTSIQLQRFKGVAPEKNKELADLLLKKKNLLLAIDEQGSKIYHLVLVDDAATLLQIPKPASQAQSKTNTLSVPQQKNNPAAQVPQTSTLSVPQPTFKTPLPLPSLKLEIPSFEEAPQPVQLQEFSTLNFVNISVQEKKKYMKELNIKREELNSFIKFQNKKDKKSLLHKEDYSIYHPSYIGAVANNFMKSTADSLVSKYPGFFELMFHHFKMVEMELLSRTYISLMLLSTLLSFPLLFLFFFILNFAFHLSILLILLIAFVGMILTFLGFYFYPASLINDKNNKIKLELPFALVHMSAVAGSGAQPVSIFQLIADSDEYDELKKEIRKVLNYVNLFGYNLTNALKNVAATTPNPEFKELLNGMISTIETGGDLRAYLKEKADEALITYKLDRKKQIEALATYSEIYTAVLIASPLLLLVTLAIINSIGGKIGGFEVGLVAWISVVGALPFLNVGFMLFTNMSNKGL